MPSDLLDLRGMEPVPACVYVLDAMNRTSSLTVLGWRLPERNLDYPAVTFVRLWSVVLGWPHVSMLAAGGIEGILHRTLLAPKSGWRIISRTPVWLGAATLLVAEKTEEKSIDSPRSFGL